MPLVPQAIELKPPRIVRLLDTVRDFARNELLPLDRRWDADDSSLFEAMPMLADMGLLNLLVPHEAGGLGCAYPLFAAILHELSVWSAATSVTLSVHSMVGTIMDRFAPEPLRTQLLAGWGRPDHFAAFALSEAGAGSDASAVRTIAVPAPGGYKINGEKMWVTNGLSRSLVAHAGPSAGASRSAELLHAAGGHDRAGADSNENPRKNGHPRLGNRGR